MQINSYMGTMRMRDIAAPIERPNLRTGAGHGHLRKSNREKPKKGIWAKKHKRTKMKKASRRQQRGGIA